MWNISGFPQYIESGQILRLNNSNTTYARMPSRETNQLKQN